MLWHNSDDQTRKLIEFWGDNNEWHQNITRYAKLMKWSALKMMYCLDLTTDHCPESSCILLTQPLTAACIVHRSCCGSWSDRLRQCNVPCLNQSWVILASRITEWWIDPDWLVPWGQYYADQGWVPLIFRIALQGILGNSHATQASEYIHVPTEQEISYCVILHFLRSVELRQIQHFLNGLGTEHCTTFF